MRQGLIDRPRGGEGRLELKVPDSRSGPRLRERDGK